MPHDERMLKTAYKSYGKQGMTAQSNRRTAQGMSHTPLVTKNYDMKNASLGL